MFSPFPSIQSLQFVFNFLKHLLIFLFQNKEFPFLKNAIKIVNIFFFLHQKVKKD